MIASAAMSSTIASVSRKTRSWVGAPAPTSASTPRAKAVSVEIATPQPWAASPDGLRAR